jgi:hypothetical protein
MKEKKKKTLWCGQFNFSHQLRIEYVAAYSREQAKSLMLRRIAKKHEVPYSYVFGLFNGERDNFSIAEER